MPPDGAVLDLACGHGRHAIPHVVARHLPAHEPAERPRLVKVAFGRLLQELVVPYRWAQFALAPHAQHG